VFSLALWFTPAVDFGRSGDPPPDPGPRLKIDVSMRPGRVLVGEAVDLVVTVEAGPGPVVVETPAVAGADLTPISETGQATDDRRVFRFRLVARRPGRLRVPPIVAWAGGLSGRAEALEIRASPLPAEARPPGFLGGVGEFSVEASADPTRVRVGQLVDYTITVRGPASAGIDRPPALERLARLAVEPRIERRPDQIVFDPPSQTFAYRLRPQLPGSATIPPVTVSMFDPRLGRYVTRATAGIPLRVLDAPRLDLATVRDPDPTPSRSVSIPVVGAVVAATALTSAVGAAVVWAGRRRADTPVALRRLGRDLARRLDAAGQADAEAQGRILEAGLISLFALKTGRPGGALTPDEAEAEAVRATGSDDLAAGARAILTRCDRARYDGPGVGDRPDPTLKADGLAFFAELVVAAGRHPRTFAGGERRTRGATKPDAGGPHPRGADRP